MSERPFVIRDAKEIPWIKRWLRGQIVGGRLNLSLETVSEIQAPEDAQRLISRELDLDGRARLQKALSASRRRTANVKPRMVTTEMDREAREMLLSVASAKGVSVSELIKEQFESVYMALQ
jgi:hypothetical protein